MNTLIVYTHPNHQSLNYAFLEHTLKGISENESISDVKVIDLYKKKFDPILFFDGDKKRSDMHMDPEFAVYREQIRWADKMVFIYPIWWGRPPAMLLGYIDQLFSTDFAYRKKDTYSHEGLLRQAEIIKSPKICN